MAVARYVAEYFRFSEKGAPRLPLAEHPEAVGFVGFPSVAEGAARVLPPQEDRLVDLRGEVAIPLRAPSVVPGVHLLP